ncbi:hypothetical protein KF707_16075 [Candidatus Obscuribacterales bacterium]|nr:hypothetical protein [Candidatus Obscuribacterales bacterium]MBX3137742.1 hypothetical protein [Candidatus Obscuribacterales bacterium]MBX3149601.1 hypothetical protein [Candidatus Obscuribacterales bacterium]
MKRVSEPPSIFNFTGDQLPDSESPGEGADMYYTLWHRQKSELVALRFLVMMQLLGIFVLSITIGCLLFRGY